MPSSLWPSTSHRRMHTSTFVSSLDEFINVNWFSSSEHNKYLNLASHRRIATEKIPMDGINLLGILCQSRDCHSTVEFEKAIKSMRSIYGSVQLFMAPGQLQEEPPSANGLWEPRPCRWRPARWATTLFYQDMRL